MACTWQDERLAEAKKVSSSSPVSQLPNSGGAPQKLGLDSGRLELKKGQEMTTKRRISNRKACLFTSRSSFGPMARLLPLALLGLAACGAFVLPQRRLVVRKAFPRANPGGAAEKMRLAKVEKEAPLRLGGLIEAYFITVMFIK